MSIKKFEVPNHITQSMSGLQADHQMNMIGNPSDALGNATDVADNPAEIGMEAIPPFLID
jgi:hypothetical protein